MKDPEGLHDDSISQRNQTFNAYRRRSSIESCDSKEREDGESHNNSSNPRSIFSEDKQLSSIWEENKKLSEELTSEIMDLTKLKWKKGKGISFQRSPIPSPKATFEGKDNKGKSEKSQMPRKDSPDFYLHVPTLLLSKTISVSRTLLDQIGEQNETWNEDEEKEEDNIVGILHEGEGENEEQEDDDYYRQEIGNQEVDTERASEGINEEDNNSNDLMNSMSDIDDVDA